MIPDEIGQRTWGLLVARWLTAACRGLSTAPLMGISAGPAKTRRRGDPVKLTYARESMSVQAIERTKPPAEKIFDIGIDQTLSYDQLFILGLQNIFGMTGMFVFPGILGRSYGPRASNRSPISTA